MRSLLYKVGMSSISLAPYTMKRVGLRRIPSTKRPYATIGGNGGGSVALILHVADIPVTPSSRSLLQAFRGKPTTD